jgi:hypothetical protein
VPVSFTSGEQRVTHDAPLPAQRRRLVEELRRRGVRGGVIPQHRAMVGLRLSPLIGLELLLVPALVTLTTVLLIPELLDAWRSFFGWMLRALHLPGNVESRVVTLFGGLSFALPLLTVQSPWPTHAELLAHGAAVLVVVGVSFLLRPTLLPLTYLLRALATIHATSVAFFLFARQPFPYPLPQYASDFLLCGLVVLAVAPFLLGLTFFIFGVPLVEKLVLSVLLVAHLAVLLPLQLMVHVYLAHRGSLVVVPLLFIALGLLLDILVFVSLYGWGMSWLSTGERRREVRTRGTHP